MLNSSAKKTQARKDSPVFTEPCALPPFSEFVPTMAAEGPIPVPNATESFWRTQPHPLDNCRSTPDLPSDADIVIIGAGFAGAALAYYIFKDNPTPPSVLILEARQACSGATGRNGKYWLGLCMTLIY